jgi:hypothetical protein
MRFDKNVKAYIYEMEKTLKRIKNREMLLKLGRHRRAWMARFDERMLGGMGVFAAIVQARSFAAAGDLLHMSQPGVSREG